MGYLSWVRFVILPFVATLVLSAQSSRISGIDRGTTVKLRGFVSSKVKAATDRGAAAADFPIDGIALHFKPTAAQQAELEQLLRDQQNPASKRYHRWLTPEQYGDRFGMGQDDVRKVTAWLKGEGFTIGHVARGRSWIVFGGTAQMIESAFKTPVHRFEYGGRMHFANTAEPSIPVALQDVTSGIQGLDDFILEPEMRVIGEATSGSTHTLAPDDIATIYGVKNLYQAGIDGTGQKVAIVGQSEIDLNDTRSFRKKYNLAVNDPTVIQVPNTTSPGITGSATEANLDLQWAGAVARNATILYVFSRSAFTSLAYAVDQNLAPVVSASYSMGCEQQNLGGVLMWRRVAMQANAQGITWVNSGGDAGGAACDSNGALVAQNGLGIRFPQSIPEVTAVGGTQFNEGSGTYWNSSNDANGASATSYIPEAVWNEVATDHALWAGGGGASILFSKPVWQTGPGVPDDGMRDTPDVALTAAAGHDGYNIVSGGRSLITGGTSASAPSFAGMLALLNHYLAANNLTAAAGLGNINPALYALAQSNPAAFHDVTVGSNIAPCASGSPNCGGRPFGFSAGPGYDLATGLGSVDLYNLVHAWNTATPTQSVIDFGIGANPVYQLAMPDSLGNNWVYTLMVAEEAGVNTTLTDLIIDGVSYAAQIPSFFKSANLPAKGFLTASLGTKTLSPPVSRTFELQGKDATGATWSQKLTANFVGPAPVPVVTGLTNAASFQQAYAPGMILSVFGTDLSEAAPQAAAVVPLTTYLGGFGASINGVLTPIYYVSPGQVNVQIPYETTPGKATLLVSNGLRTGTFSFQVDAAAPGIFAGSDGSAVPNGSGSPGKTYTLFITGEGQVSPALATGAPPSLLTPVNNLPKPKVPVAMTIGGVDAPIAFVGIPYGLVGATQINFTVPAAAPLGKQPLIVTVGGIASPAVNFTVVQ